MKVSVVLPVYNTEKQLSKCIESILNQALTDLELLIVNDASPDNSLDIIREFMQRDNRITLFNLETNMGVSHARNLGLKHAQGECVYFPDSDDYIEKDLLLSMYEAVIDNDCDMAACNYRYAYDDAVGPPFLKMPEKRIIDVQERDGAFVRDVLGETQHIGGCVFNKLFNTSFLKKSRVLFAQREEIFAEDAYFYFTLLPRLNRIYVLDKPLYFYYQRSTSVSHTYKPNLLNRCINFLEGVRSEYVDLPYYDKLKDAFNIRAFTFFLEILHNETFHKQDYAGYRVILNNRYFRDRAVRIDASMFPRRGRIIHFLYRHRLYFFIYIILKLRS